MKKRSEDVSDEDSETFHPPRSIVVISLGLIVLVSAIGLVYAFGAFSQILPQFTVQAQFGLTPCSPLVEHGAISPSAGIVMYDCSGKPAFNVTGGPGSATVSFHIQTNPSTITTSLGITPNGSCSGFTTLTNNTAISLGDGGYDYCLSYSNVPSSGGTVGPVTISWS